MSGTDGEPVPGRPPEVDRKDVVAMALALFQLFAPLVLALALVGALVGIVLRCSR
ncbi:MAG: hypothetical protein PHX77_05680 [Candidatus Bipolaricaulis sp.]|nr:hypothetical protein [Candidatus Bipolaricaulis sp.]MDD5645902.1 hypothetical protein [Candidatus Bipolaricaulis sp.]